MIFRLTNDRFPPATSVGAYLASAEWPGASTPPPTQGPKSAAVDTVVIDSSGAGTFSGLAADTAYWAVGQVSGDWRWVRIKTEPSQTATYITEDPEDRPFEIDTPADLAVSAFRIRKGPTTIFEIDQNGFLIAGALAAQDLTVWEGGDPSGVSDSSASLQTLLDSLHSTRVARGVQGDTIIIPTGLFKMSSEVTYYCENGYAQSIVGQGQSTKFKVTADLGRNKYMLRPSNSRTSIQKPFLGHFNFRGNPISVEWNMHGVALPSGSMAEKLYCEGGFRGGLVALNDHTIWLDCESHGSRFNLYFGYQYQAKDNHIVRGGNYTDGLLACIGCAGNNGIGGSEFTGFHVGNAPYCFYKEDAADPTGFDTFNAEPINVGLNAFFSSNECTGLRFENSQLGIFYAVNPAAGAPIEMNLFMGCDQSGQGYSGTFQSAFVCDYFTRNIFIRAESLFVADNGHKYVEATNQIYANRVEIGNTMPTWIVANDLDNKDRSGWVFESTIGEVFIAKKCDANVNAGDLLTGWVGGFAGSVKPFDTSFASAVLGVARDTVASGGYVLIQKRGYCNRVNIVAGATPDSGALLVPSTTIGKAVDVAPGAVPVGQSIGRGTTGDLGGYCQAVLDLW